MKVPPSRLRRGCIASDKSSVVEDAASDTLTLNTRCIEPMFESEAAGDPRVFDDIEII